ncbi:MAG: macro domain-containing protein, partial [Cyclobacteriaceae bacterium]|nr:macro domain-containing protein [Cyclobacteriaceae bacterium]
ADLLGNCYINSLKLASDYHCRSVAFPNISTGIYGYPKALAARIAVETIYDFLKEDDQLQKVILCCFDDENYTYCLGGLERLGH